MLPSTANEMQSILGTVVSNEKADIALRTTASKMPWSYQLLRSQITWEVGISINRENCPNILKFVCNGALQEAIKPPHSHARGRGKLLSEYYQESFLPSSFHWSCLLPLLLIPLILPVGHWIRIQAHISGLLGSKENQTYLSSLVITSVM